MRNRPQRVIRAVVLEVEGAQYEIHLGRPGRPRIYRRVGPYGNLRRVPAGDPVLPKIATEFRTQVDVAKKRDRRWGTRLRRWLGRLWARIRRRRRLPLAPAAHWLRRVIPRVHGWRKRLWRH